MDEDAYLGFEENLIQAVDEWSKTTKAATFIMYTEQGYVESWAHAIQRDLPSVFVSGVILSIYLAMFLGNFSPIFCRCTVALAAIFSMVLAFFSAFGLLYFCGFHTSTFHSWLPFLVMSIGIEHTFVICNAVDATRLDHTAYERIHEALSHAGPAITITTLTTCLAFLSGMLSSLQALRSFCLFATVTTAMLYLSNMTFFLAVLVWDTRRVQHLKKECFSLCCCKETSRLCCKGKLASHKQRDYVGNVKFRVADMESARSQDSMRSSQPSSPLESRTARKEIQHSPHSERFCGNIVAPILLHNFTRVTVLFIYAVLIAGACYFVTDMEVYFSQSFFVSDNSQIKAWFDANQMYFHEGGDKTETYVQNDANVDFSNLDQ